MKFQSQFITAIAVYALAVSGCSGGDPEEKQDHVFEQTKAIDKAREVEGFLKDAASKQKESAGDGSQ